VPDSVLSVIRQLSNARSQDEIMAVVSQAVRALLQADGATLAIRDGDHIRFVADDAISPLWTDRRLPLNGCVAGWCMTHAEPVAVLDIYQDARIFTPLYRPDFVRSLAMAPVGLEKPIAALGAYWTELREPQPGDVERLQAIADGTALAMTSLQQPHAAASYAPRPRPASRRATDGAAPARLSPRFYVERFLHQGLRPDSRAAYAFGVACMALVTLVRLAAEVAGTARLTIFSFYYPALVVVLLVAGFRAGVLAAVLGGVAAAFFFLEPKFQFALGAQDLINLILYAGSCAFIILAIDAYQRAVMRLKHEDARHLTLAREQQHRGRNALAVVEIVVRQTLADDRARARTIIQRVRAAFADVDIRVHSRPIRMSSLLNQELEPFELKRFTFELDDETALPPEVSSILTLAAHELATNALKYGALSAPGGQVTVTGGAGGGEMRFHWRESGGPPVRAPTRRGFGSVMLHRLVESAGGAIDIQFPATGVTAEISAPLEPVPVGLRQANRDQQARSL
jgi:two-component sensor histidine kinase